MRTAAVFLLITLSVMLRGQNLVENGSFENTGDCPISSTFLQDYLNPWITYFGTPDYYNLSCGFPGDASTTNNALPFDGDGFIGLNLYGDTGTAYAREYIHGELKTPLEKGKYYRVTFYVKPLNNDAVGLSYAINNIGMLLTDSVVDTIPDDRLLEYQPQIIERDPVVAESYWTAICGIYLAKGGEEFFTIGNFSSDINTTVTPLSGASNPQSAYYLFDYVEVVENDLPQLPADTILCNEQRIDIKINEPDVEVLWSDGSSVKNFIITEPGTYTARISTPGCSYIDTILVEPANCDECKMYIPNAFTPNGDGLNETFEIKASCAEEIVDYRISIFDRWGRKVFESNSLEIAWDGKNADNQGVYTYTIEYTYPVNRDTQTLTRRGTITLIK